MGNQKSSLISIVKSSEVQRAIDEINKVEIVIPDLTKKVLIRLACAHYNAYYASNSRTASPKDPDEFIFRITVNYLRHELTSYDEALVPYLGTSVEKAAHDALKERVLDAIATAYPWIRKECAAQKKTIYENT